MLCLLYFGIQFESKVNPDKDFLLNTGTEGGSKKTG
jgi:hypothetical protein